MDPSFLIRQPFEDFDDFCETARNWDLDFHQLESGQFSGEMLMFGNNRVLFAHTRLGRKLRQRGATPPGLITIGVLTRPEIFIDWRNIHVSGDMLIVFPEGGELDSITHQDFDVLVVSLSEAKLNETCRYLDLPDFRMLTNNAEAFHCDSKLIADYRTWLLSVGELLTAGSNADLGERYLDHFEQELADRLIRIFSANHHPAARKPFRKRDSALLVAEEYIVESDSSILTIPELCSAAGVSERTLEYAFQERYGITPKRYLMFYRMNNVRKQLRMANPKTIRVMDIARQNGFWHMGAFSNDYKKLFAELPSETLSS